MQPMHVEILGWLSLGLAVLASLHILLYKRNVRSAMGWIALVWLSPLIGALLYPLFGINRVRRRAMALRPKVPGSPQLPSAQFTGSHSAQILEFGRRATGRPALVGNAVQPLWDGDEAYPRMLSAIEKAEHSVCLSSYIFDRDALGLRFVDALVAAARRGVEVRVLLDDVGAHYSLLPVDWILKKRGVKTARFLPVLSMRSVHLMNLRLHRKILVLDGRTAFVGGMNIREGHLLNANPRRPTRDVHFQVTGPIVAELQDAFAEDWGYTTGEYLKGPKFFPELSEAGKMVCRTVVDGPDRYLDTVRLLFHGAIASAQKSILIVTPYFLPDPILSAALNVAAMRGVRVQILVPENNNLPWCHWAMQYGLRDLVSHGCEVYFSKGDFDHSKIFVVDETWSLIGSSNWDERSLRLNFEVNLECYDATFAKTLCRKVNERLLLSQRVGLVQLDDLPLYIRIRDGIARLFTPYL
jgi:cardiolipin synthase A/B